VKADEGYSSSWTTPHPSPAATPSPSRGEGRPPLLADLDGGGGLVGAGDAAVDAGPDIVGADAPVGAGVAVDPGGPADRLAGFAGDGHRFLHALLDEIDLVVARPRRLAAVKLDRHVAGMPVVDKERHAVGGGRLGGEQEGDEGEANHGARPMERQYGIDPSVFVILGLDRG